VPDKIKKPDRIKKPDEIKNLVPVEQTGFPGAKMTERQEGAIIHVAPSPHIVDTHSTTQKMMIDVIIALLPIIFLSIYLFRIYAVKQLFICIITCIASEFLFVRMRGRSMTLKDCSAGVTGIILALSLPGSAPLFVGVIASIVAMGIGKIIFGGLGMNIFNPAMVGRAFVMIAFAQLMGAASYENVTGLVDAVSGATPLSALKFNGLAMNISPLFWGTTNGSLGETSTAACLVGGVFLILRKTGYFRHHRYCRLPFRQLSCQPSFWRGPYVRRLFHCNRSCYIPAYPKRKMVFRPWYRYLDNDHQAFFRLPGRGNVCRSHDECRDPLDQSLDHPSTHGRSLI